MGTLNIKIFQRNFFQFLKLKKLCILHGQVFVMFCRPEIYFKIDACSIVDTYIINNTISHWLNFTPIVNWYTFETRMPQRSISHLHRAK